jgi:GAF domain-containing protein
MISPAQVEAEIAALEERLAGAGPLREPRRVPVRPVIRTAPLLPRPAMPAPCIECSRRELEAQRAQRESEYAVRAAMRRMESQLRAKQSAIKRMEQRSMQRRAALQALIVVSDVETEELDASTRETYRRRLKLRAVVAVPMVHEGRPIGVIGVSRGTPGPFSRHQIDLLQTFADQAVIAIENVRLFTELATSNREIAEKSRQLEVASQHKSEFLANMSHELRTPLRS